MKLKNFLDLWGLQRRRSQRVSASKNYTNGQREPDEYLSHTQLEHICEHYSKWTCMQTRLRFQITLLPFMFEALQNINSLCFLSINGLLCTWTGYTEPFITYIP